MEPELPDCLSPDEQLRAQRFRFPIHRSRFVQGRCFLRSVLAWHLNWQPRDIDFHVQANGKPLLARQPLTQPPWHFSFSRSGDTAVCGTVAGRSLGVDIESHKEMPDMESVARTILDPQDQHVWASIPPHQKPQSFFRIWARKEARGKASGRGISDGANRIKVPLHRFKPGDCQMLAPDDWEASHVESAAVTHWCLSDWDCQASAAASIVLGGRSGECFRHYQDQPAATPPPPASGRQALCPLLRRAALTVRRFQCQTEWGNSA